MSESNPRVSALIVFGILLFVCAYRCFAQQGTPTPTASPSPTPLLYSPQTLADLKRLQQAALNSNYAYRQVAHLANNIGPRLSGSAQAQKAVEYIAGELKALGLEVQLEKVMVPHWVRGDETAALVQFPGQTESTTQKIVLTALGGSVATPAKGLTADLVVVRNFEGLKSLVATKSRARSCSSITPSISRWQRKDMAAMRTAKRLFIETTVPAKQRSSVQLWPCCARSVARITGFRTLEIQSSQKVSGKFRLLPSQRKTPI